MKQVKDTALTLCKKLRFFLLSAFASTFQVKVATDAECQEKMATIDVSQSLLCARGDSKGVCNVSFLSKFQPQHFSSSCDLFRATVGAL